MAEIQITVLDAGGQYCHLIARKVRELGVYAEVRPSDTPVAELAGRKGIIISGGPSSVYEADSPKIDPGVFDAGIPVLGICYGLQVMAYTLGGAVQKGEKGEYGLAHLAVIRDAPLFAGMDAAPQQVWMSHRDLVRSAPPGFEVLGQTETCAVAAMGHTGRGLYGVQFHPEVVHTTRGKQLLENFLFGICGCERDWDPRRRAPQILDWIRQTAGDRNIFFFVSGGVDSSVAFALCLKALGRERVRGIYVDTGLMREGETEFVKSVFERYGDGAVSIEHAQDEFLGQLTGVREPERKRQIIGEAFVTVQDRILQSEHFLEGDWILGQGTIYPDTIESGGTKHAAVIKTHHNRVAGIQKLIEAGRIIEPLSSFYKDEVREIGEELGLPGELLHRHPFPGPGLAIRCLCSEADFPVKAVDDGWVIPVHSVGVQGDSRSYAPVLALDMKVAGADPHKRATDLINRVAGINRVVGCVDARMPVASMQIFESALTPERLALLRCADAIVRRLSHESGFDREVWQFPVVLIPVGRGALRDSVVLRPIDSVDGMTARAVPVPEPLLRAMSEELLELPLAAVFLDLTNKPPATIEWE